MAISLVQSKGNTANSNTSVSVTLDSAVTAGNRLVAVIKNNDGVDTFNSLPSGWAWGPNSPFVVASGRQFGVLHKLAGSSESQTLTLSTVGAFDKEIALFEVADIAAPTLGVTTSNQIGQTSKTLTTTGTLAQANNFVVSICDQALNNGGEVSVDSGFTLQLTSSFILMMVATKITSATTALAPTFVWTTSRATGGLQTVFPEDLTPPGPAGYQAKAFDGSVWKGHIMHQL